jgi:hypothetical protein
MNHFRTISATILLGLGLLAFTGCGGDSVQLGEVKGTVTVDGQPVEGLEVRFNPEEGGTSLGYTQADGSYELSFPGGAKGAVVGRHTVSVMAAETDDGSAKVEIPVRYNEESELTFEVKSGENTYNIEITTQ